MKEPKSHGEAHSEWLAALVVGEEVLVIGPERGQMSIGTVTSVTRSRCFVGTMSFRLDGCDSWKRTSIRRPTAFARNEIVLNELRAKFQGMKWAEVPEHVLRKVEESLSGKW